MRYRRAVEKLRTAWYYPIARKIRNHVAFWNGVQVDLAAQPMDQASAAG
jgi:uncharacterized protein (DUF427 family)